MNTTSRAPITVGVDGSDTALAAVRWAAAEAGTRDAPLRLCCAAQWPDGHHLADVGVAVESEHAVLARARHWLDDASTIANSVTPALTITTEIVRGNPVTMLVDASDTARMMVVGSRGLGGFTGLLLGSTAIGVTARTRCPAVVVRGLPAAPGARVVVGVDGSADDDTTLELAFDEAATHGVDLLVLHTWHDELVPYAREPILIDWAQIRRDERAEIEARLVTLRAGRPGVGVELIVTKGKAARALVELSDTAGLLVVGCRGRGGLAGLLLGSTSQTLIRHAACPVAVVPHSGARTAEPSPERVATASHSG